MSSNCSIRAISTENMNNVFSTRELIMVTLTQAKDTRRAFIRIFTTKDGDGWYRSESLHMNHGENGRKQFISRADKIKSRSSQDGCVDWAKQGTNDKERHDPWDRLGIWIWDRLSNIWWQRNSWWFELDRECQRDRERPPLHCKVSDRILTCK